MSHDIEIIGDGCAALSFAARASEVNGNVTLIRPNNAPAAKDHVWGFWSDPILHQTENIPKSTWKKWAIITDNDRVVLESENKSYNAFKRSDWTKHCENLAKMANVKFINESDWERSADSTVFDTRPPIVPNGCVLQHFHGIEISTTEKKFDPNVAILMDFRVDQSKGLHFIYLLPYSETEALIESTIFSTNVVEKQYYLDNIKSYLESNYQIDEYFTTHQESGVIPLGKLALHDPNIPGLGTNGGATRPASGYTFLFIQRQIEAAIKSANNSGGIRFKNPHKRIDLWMDSILLTVLKHWPEHGPNIFLRMGKALSGEQFVNFLSGDASWWLRLRVIFAMPKWPFIKALTKNILPSRKSSNAVVA